MTEPVFDAAGYLNLDLETGSIRSSDQEQLAVIPMDLLGSLQPGEELDKRARAWGETAGENLAVMALEAEDSSSLDMLAQHLAGSLAVAGFGKVKVDVRDDALLFRVTSRCNDDARPALVALVGGFLSGYLSAVISPERFDVTRLHDEDDAVVFWAGNPDAVQRLKGMVADGVKPFDALDLLARGVPR